jgi:hypothetical protein
MHPREVTLLATSAFVLFLLPACQPPKPPVTDPRLRGLEPILPEAEQLAEWYRSKQGYVTENSSPPPNGFLVWSERAGNKVPGEKVNLELGRLTGKCVLVQFQAYPGEQKPSYYIVSPAQLELPAELRAETPDEVGTIVLLAYSETQRMYAPTGQRDGSPVKGEFCEILAFERGTRQILARSTAVTSFPESTHGGPIPLEPALIVKELLGVTARREALAAALTAADRFFARLREDGRAEDSLSAAARREETPEQFARRVKELGLTDYASAAWERRTVRTTGVELEGFVTLRQGRKVWLQLALAPEEGAWKVSSIHGR